MIKATNYVNIIKTLRSTIINITGIKGEKILNKNSVRGTDLSKIIDEVDVMSFDLSDVVILFDLLENDTDNNFIIPEKDNTTSSLASYKFALQIYGNFSYEYAQMIMTKLRDQGVLHNLIDNGIYFSGTSYPANSKEFINNTLWQRCDLDILIEVRYNFENPTKEEYFEEVGNDIKVINI